MSPRAATKAEPTTQARLQSVIKTSRQIMRKDAGLNGELDRLPQLAWLLFLKAFDDLETERTLIDAGYEPALPGPLRWSRWAHKQNVTGEPFVRFVNDELLPHLRKVRGTGRPGDPHDTLGLVFSDVRNRMQSGHLLRQLVDQVDRISFTSRDEVHTMAVFYETMLREMRDAAGDSGEFYTPRPVIRFVVDQVDPRPGDKVLDPACGTGGFLVESFRHMTAGDLSTADHRKVVTGLRGIEKKGLPFLLCQMNLLLNGVHEPKVTEGNALAYPLAEIRRDGVDVVMTNPPFGGEEETLILDNFPRSFRTAETVWLFLQSVMARIEKSSSGRCGIVVPNSVLFDTGVGGRIKKDLMSRFNLHTVVRLPNGVFSPYTLIPSNILFFEKGEQGPVWFYEVPPPEGRKNYTKTKPMRYEEFEPCQAWWGGCSREGRAENEHAWKVEYSDIEAGGFSLDLHNPNRPDALDQRPPGELIAELLETQKELLAVYEEMRVAIAEFEL